MLRDILPVCSHGSGVDHGAYSAKHGAMRLRNYLHERVAGHMPVASLIAKSYELLLSANKAHDQEKWSWALFFLSAQG